MFNTMWHSPAVYASKLVRDRTPRGLLPLSTSEFIISSMDSVHRESCENIKCHYGRRYKTILYKTANNIYISSKQITQSLFPFVFTFISS